MTKIILGNYYRLKGNNHCWAKPIDIIPPKTGVNTHSYPIFKCEWTQNKNDSIGLIKYFSSSRFYQNKERMMELKDITNDNQLLEVGSKAVEDILIDFRDNRIHQFGRVNGLVIRERSGQDSSIIRLGIEDALRIGIKAIADYLEELQEASK